VLVPGWVGIASIKWVGRIEVSEEPPVFRLEYRLLRPRRPDLPAGGEAQGPRLDDSGRQERDRASLASEPGGRQHTIRGRSWSGQGRIVKVEYRVDGGAWQKAQLHEPILPLAWTRWSFTWDAPPGEHAIRVRATDDRGNAQPDSVPFNEMGVPLRCRCRPSGQGCVAQ
jgi:DMSO/TMAO reductase YedYZ molybdopterin-dependent catalytic subunit